MKGIIDTHIQHIGGNKIKTMKRYIDTPKGRYTYQLKIVYEGVKKIDKEKAKQNLQLFNVIAKRNGLKFGILFGTFLGAMREHDIIEHDEDMDIFVLGENKQLFLSMLFELRENGFEVIRYDRRGDLCSIMRNGEYIDVSFFEPINEEVRLALSYFVPQRFLTDLSPYSFLEDEFYGPTEWEDYLLFWYGETWRQPIQRDNFELPQWRIIIQKIKWFLFFKIPKPLFKKIIIRRLRPKIEQYNDRVERINRIKGIDYLKKINNVQEVLDSVYVRR